MNVLDLLSSLRKANIQISLVDDNLKIKAPKGAVTPDIKQQLADAKQEIIDFLKEAAAPVVAAASIPVQSRTGELRLSWTQEALWTLDRMNPGSIAYNLPMAFRFYGGLDVAVLEKAIGTILERHEILRLRVKESEKGEPVADIMAPAPFHLPVHDLIVEGASNAAERLAVEQYAMQPFDLAQGPLYRFELVRVSSNSTEHDQVKDQAKEHELLIICLHHIISDGLSQNLLVREIAMLYAAYLQNAPAPLAPLPVQYLDFAAWQRQQLTGDNLAKEIEFWQQQLRNVPSLLALPTDRPRPPIQTSHGARYHFDIPAATANGVIQFTQAHGYTLFMGLMAALQMVLSRHARQNEFCLGMPTAGRHLKEVEQLIGFFVNGVLVRASIQPNASWQQHLDAVKQRLLDVLSHQQTPAQLIIEHLDVPRNPAYPPLAQVGFQLQNFAGSVQSSDDETRMLEAFSQMTRLTMEPVRLEEADSKFDLIVSVAQHNSELSGYVEYNTDLFDESTVARLMQHFSTALDSMVTQPACRLANVQLQSPEALARELGVAPEDQLAPLTSTQMAFLQDIQLRPDTRQYAVGFRYAINNLVQPALLEQAINQVIACHPVLRARFLRCDLPWTDAAWQVFRSRLSLTLEVIDIGVQDDADEFVARHHDNWCYRAHDIFNDELIRFQLLVSGERCWLLLSCHHIILDGMSGMAMLRKIIQGYEALLVGGSLPWFEDNFHSYIATHLDNVDQPQAVTFWQQKAASVAPLTFSMPVAWPWQRDYQILGHGVDASLLSDIQAYCRKQKTHPSILYRLVAALLVAEYCRPEEDFVLWDIQSGRQPGEESAIGVFYQQVPFIIPRALLDGDHTAADFYQHQRSYRREIRDHTFMSLAQLNQLFPRGSLNVQLNYFNFLEPVAMAGSASLPYTFSSHVDNTLQIFVKDYGTSLEFELWFDGAVFVPQDFLPRMESITRQLIANPQQALRAVQFDLPAEQTLLAQWNQTQQPLTYASIVPWLQQAAQDYSANLALIHGDVRLSYGELDRLTSQLANLLAANGVGQGDAVGILLGRSQWSVLAVLAVIKLGALYVPIEVNVSTIFCRTARHLC